MSALTDLLPVLAFFLTYKFAGIYTATVVLMVATVLQAHADTAQTFRVAEPAVSPAAVKALLEYSATPLAGADALTQGRGEANGEGALRAALEAASERRVELSLDVADDSALVFVDPDQLRHAVEALVRNGIRFTPDGGSVEVRARAEGDELRHLGRRLGAPVEMGHQRLAKVVHGEETADIGGLDEQIEQIADAVELPFLYADLFAEHQLPAPKGILLYGPPGCGKTLIAKAVANSLAKKVAEHNGGEKGRSYFINIKGPELLNKYVGETERQIRLVFQRAREKSEEGWPVIVFFDEMDSMFRTRGSGISSDMESTIVPQLLAEIDGVEGLRNVIVIGATNREDLIDPAILRPGRLDVKIKIERPDMAAAKQIFARYLTADLPLDDAAINAAGGDRERALDAMIDETVAEMYRADTANQFLEVTYQNGDREVMYFKDFSSGAMIENIVRRAKKLAIKRLIGGGSGGISVDDLIAAIHQEYKEHEDLPNTTNPDDWAKISGKKGERIVFIRTLVKGLVAADREGGRAIERVATGQYL